MTRKLSPEELNLMEQSGYSKKAIAFYANNVNVGKIQEPTLTTTFFGSCGDLIKLYLKINAKNKIKKAKFYYLGCPGAASSASAMTILVQNKTINNAKNLTSKDILNYIEGLPKAKQDCAELSIKTLKKAIGEYEQQKGKTEI